MQTGRRDLIGLKERRRGLEGPCECVSERKIEIKGASAHEGDAELDNPEAISASVYLSVRPSVCSPLFELPATEGSCQTHLRGHGEVSGARTTAAIGRDVD